MPINTNQLLNGKIWISASVTAALLVGLGGSQLAQADTGSNNVNATFLRLTQPRGLSASLSPNAKFAKENPAVTGNIWQQNFHYTTPQGKINDIESITPHYDSNGNIDYYEGYTLWAPTNNGLEWYHFKTTDFKTFTAYDESDPVGLNNVAIPNGSITIDGQANSQLDPTQNTSVPWAIPVGGSTIKNNTKANNGQWFTTDSKGRSISKNATLALVSDMNTENNEQRLWWAYSNNGEQFKPIFDTPAVVPGNAGVDANADFRDPDISTSANGTQLQINVAGGLKGKLYNLTSYDGQTWWHRATADSDMDIAAIDPDWSYSIIETPQVITVDGQALITFGIQGLKSNDKFDRVGYATGTIDSNGIFHLDQNPKHGYLDEGTDDYAGDFVNTADGWRYVGWQGNWNYNENWVNHVGSFTLSKKVTYDAKNGLQTSLINPGLDQLVEKQKSVTKQSEITPNSLLKVQLDKGQDKGSFKLDRVATGNLAPATSTITVNWQKTDGKILFTVVRKSTQQGNFINNLQIDQTKTFTVNADSISSFNLYLDNVSVEMEFPEIGKTLTIASFAGDNSRWVSQYDWNFEITDGGQADIKTYKKDAAPYTREVTHTEKIVYKGSDGKELGTKTATIVETIHAHLDNTTGDEVVDSRDYSNQSGKFDAVDNPNFDGYVLNPKESKAVAAYQAGTDEDADNVRTITVNYDKTRQPNDGEKFDTDKSVTRTLNWVDDDENQKIVQSEEQKISYHRDVRYIDEVTGDAQYGDWKESSNSFKAETMDALANYKIANDGQPIDVDATTVKDETLHMVHKHDNGVDKKTVSRPIKYVDENGAQIKVPDSTADHQDAEVTQSYDQDLVTKQKTATSAWSTPSYAAFTHPDVPNYDYVKTSEDDTNGLTFVYKAKSSTVTESKTVDRPVRYVDEAGKVIKDATKQSVTLTRTGVKNDATGEVVWQDWPEAKFDNQSAPTIDKYAYDKTSENDNKGLTFVYQAATKSVTDKKTIKRTIHFIDVNGKPLKDDEVQSQGVSRAGSQNEVTGDVTWGDWSLTTFDAEKVPEIAGYSTEDKIYSVTTSTDQDVTVTYKKDGTPTPSSDTPSTPTKPTPAAPAADKGATAGNASAATNAHHTSGLAAVLPATSKQVKKGGAVIVTVAVVSALAAFFLKKNRED
ncbi:mucin-binding protein [Fructobacillus durionis]|uniref:Sucrose-6-phosphate hydrolase SacC, GH32 family n=1 Tax=Fructobacillus durionis TaxID=283737 RepID=A0A1I1EBF7_9LACO|nr:hypothetical protein [Fructobacillus durionis]SFB82708.1 Sucrose-6-phosphate hydrolase SacC, GH32 family [Fructobacillus durionis]